jgi:hypothetical protein
MMMFRRAHNARDRMQDLQIRLRSGLLADTTRDMSAYSGDAQTLINELLTALRETLAERGTSAQENSDEVKIERRFIDAAANSLNLAWASAEDVGAGTDIAEMRARLLEVKTHADFAHAYLNAALGTERE